MEFFEHNFSLQDAIEKKNPKKWILDRALRLRNKKKIEAFSVNDYLANPSKYIHFEQLASEFVCANPDCQSKNVRCIWYHYNGIDEGFDETFGEFYCDDCKKYTFVEYLRDSG